ncbi:MAG: ABC transporter substrate-binding protein [Prevotellaceae bacterium]|jgi:NitT/TauT family transport system substrate-binding protein|nr:ABC transporter substrate-binding protein [Prevotellaceae bacterium]
MNKSKHKTKRLFPTVGRDLATAKITLATALLLFLVSCGGGKKPDSKFPFGRVEIQALSGSACVAPSYIAKELGFFEREGIDVTLVGGDFESNKLGLSTGQFPVANGDYGFFPAAYNGLDIKLVAGLHQGCIQVLAPPGSDIRTAADLAGKRIGIDEIGGSPMAVTSVLLANSGIDPQKGVTWIPFPRDILPTIADKSKEVDAVALWDPWGPLAVKRGYTLLCDISTHPLFAGKYCCFIFASGQYVKEKPELIRAILRAYRRASEWIAANPEETAKIVVEKDYVASSDTALITQLIVNYRYHSRHGHAEKAQARDDALYFSRELKKTGFLPADLDPEKFVEHFYFDVFGDDDVFDDGDNGAHAVRDTVNVHPADTPDADKQAAGKPDRPDDKSSKSNKPLGHGQE